MFVDSPGGRCNTRDAPRLCHSSHGVRDRGNSHYVSNLRSINMAAQSPTDHTGLGAGLKKVVVASMSGTVVEWYEFFLYAAASTLVFGHLFFPNSDSDLDGIMKAFLTYAVGFIARPIGGIVFGHFGDKFGRKKLLQFSIILVGVSTFLMGCLPGFDAIGYGAPMLLVLLRFIQGFAVGGEWGGAVLLVAEHS